MHIAALNISGLSSDPNKMTALLQYLKLNMIDVVMLSESHITASQAEQLSSRYPNLGIYTNSPYRNQLGMTAIVLNFAKIPKDSISVYYNDEAGRALGIRCKIEGSKSFRYILGVYAPNGETDNVEFYNHLALSDGLARADIVLGDFNRVEESIDRCPIRLEDPRVLQALHGMKAVRRLTDGWRETNPDERKYTYNASNRLSSSSRIDRIYMTPKAARKSFDWRITPATHISDHDMVSVRYHPRAQVETGKGQWYMNVHHFNKPAFRQAVTDVLSKYIPKILEGWSFNQDETSAMDTPTQDPDQACDAGRSVEMFETMMAGIRSAAVALQKSIGKEQNKAQLKLERKIAKLEAEPHRNRAKARKIKILRARLKAFMHVKQANRSLISHAKWLSHGKPKSADFWALGHAPVDDRSILGLQDAQGKVRCKSDKILKVATDFYKQLYEKKSTSKAAQRKLHKLITPGDFTNAVGAVSTKEVAKIISHWSIGTVPGPDGIPLDFFKEYLRVDINGDTLLKALSVLLTILVQPDKYGMQIPATWTEGCIKIVHKKNEKTDIKNYRPLSMTNSIYKLFTGLIMGRIIGPLDECIGKHQSGFMPLRSIFDNIKEAQTLIDRADQCKSPLYVALLDQEKAYDQVDHGYLWGCLKRLGVPKALITAIQGCYLTARSTVSVNRFISDPFEIQRGVRQGDPLSCILYNVAIEPLAKYLLNEPRLPGYVDQNGKSHKISMYADDTAVYLTDLKQWKVLRRKFRRYEKATGAALNEPKCVIVAAGVESVPDRIGPIRVTLGVPTKYLGIPIGSKIDQQELWHELLIKIERIIARWNQRFLSLRQRISVVKTCLDSTLYFYLRCLPATTKDLAPIEKAINRYMWASKGEKVRAPIAHAQLTRPIVEGGLNVMNLTVMKQALSLYWIAKLEASATTEHQPGWVQIVKEILTHGYPETTRKKLTRPWVQVWDARQGLPPASVEHFWHYWSRVHLNNQPTPPSRAHLNNILFWYHPQLSLGRASPRWGSKVWTDLFRGVYTPEPVSRIGQLIDIANGVHAVPQNVKQAVQRVILKFPEQWKVLLNETHDDRVQEIQAGVYSRRSKSTIDLNSDNRAIYEHLLVDTYVPKDLLSTFKTLCARDSVDLTNIPDKDIWSGLYHPESYAKFTDLYWRLIMAITRTGEAWMDKSDCPMCGETQLAEHLFWRCPAAKQVWLTVQRQWHGITGTEMQFPRTWAALLLLGVAKKTGDQTAHHELRRWRIMFSEAMWAIWSQRCAWSFNETADFSETVILSIYRARLLKRVQIDRQLTGRTANSEFTEDSFRITWGYNQAVESEPDWLSC